MCVVAELSKIIVYTKWIRKFYIYFIIFVYYIVLRLNEGPGRLKALHHPASTPPPVTPTSKFRCSAEIRFYRKAFSCMCHSHASGCHCCHMEQKIDIGCSRRTDQSLLTLIGGHIVQNLCGLLEELRRWCQTSKPSLTMAAIVSLDGS